MSVTDADRNALLRKFYLEELLPAPERLRQRQVRFFSLAPDREDPPSTYFEARRDSTTASYVFELENLPSPSWLRVRWEEHPELLAIVEPLVELSRAPPRPIARLRKADAVKAASEYGTEDGYVEQREEESGEVSPLTYAMF
jgi:hypothetical protein